MSVEAVTWWGHATTTIELGGVRVVTDPLLPRRLYHLRRALPEPPREAVAGDVVLVSHLHHDHLHLPSLRQCGRVPLLVPRGASALVPGLAALDVVEVAPGDRLTVAGVDVEVLAASHDGTRDKVTHRLARRREMPPALGFRFAVGDAAVWYPGDTGVRPDFADVDPVDLAVVPIGGWGPTLGDDHLDPEQAVAAAAAVGARWAIAVHYGTYWPLALRRLSPANHHRLFVTPPQRFHEAADAAGLAATPLTPAFGERVPLTGPAA
ncbi:MBL fold metallo-hydrolase [Nocardioides marinquilinus]|uniref:MBL fold metallo-hydrolase n=1 Tax=Nocardioides marinquilinus TaxID=1210400 RepID=A0ABP9PQJ1_9ACTN